MPPILSAEADAGGGASVAGGLVGKSLSRYVGGGVSIVRGGAFIAVPNVAPLSVPASPGDLIGFSANMLVLVPSDTAFFDVATLVGGNPVHYFSGGTGVVGNLGLLGWYSPSAADQGDGQIDGTVYYVVQANDIAAGQVTVGLRARAVGSTADPTIAADANDPLLTALINWGQA